ncbi:MAG: ATP-binding protein [Acholeplasmatales bacterium]|nr:ATP-binding protein [Acholeplasmatales bacterium]
MRLSLKNKSILKYAIYGIFMIMCLFMLTSCASVKKTGMSTNFKCQCTYDAETNQTKVLWTSDIENQSIYDMEKLFFRFELFKNNESIEKTEKITYDIQIKHGKVDSGNRVFYADGEFDDAKIYVWDAEFATLWDSYSTWFIITIVAVSIISIAIMIMIIFKKEDILTIFGDYGSLVIGFVPCILLGMGGIGSWISANWVPICIVGAGVLATALIVALVALVAFIIREFNIDIEAKYIAVVILSLGLIGMFVLGCLFWKWWAMLAIYVGGTLFILTILFTAKKMQTFFRKRNGENKEENVEEENNSEQTDSVENKPKKKIKSIKSNISFSDIAGLEEAKKAFREKVILPFEHPELYERFGKKAGGGILLYGLPGTGKTMFAEATSNELDATFIPVKCSDIKSKWYGESEQNIKDIFEEAKRHKKSIIFFDEFEAIGAKRTDNSENGNNDLVPEILALMQGVGTSNSKNTIMIIAATNKPWAIDSAFMRPGRFDEKIYIPLPDFEARKYLFMKQLEKLPVAEDLDYDYLANITDGFNGADIKEVCEKLKMSAISDSLEKGSEQTIGMDDVKRIEKTIKSSVQSEDIEKLKEYEENI